MDIQALRKQNIAETKKKLKEAVDEDDFIVQSINSISEIDKTINLLVKRAREWYSLHNPEFSRKTEDHKDFVEQILAKKVKAEKDSMGAEIELEPVIGIIKEIKELYALRENQEKYVEKVMQGYCPNVAAVAGALIGARLLALAGDLKRVVEFPASTVQLLGAEKALFRHIKTGAKSPKYGVIINHPLVMKADRKSKGKVARALADKILLAAKVDYFKGKFIGDELRRKLEERFGK